MNVSEPLRRLALTTPDRPALIGHDDTVLDFATLDELIDLVGLEAERRGLVPGDVVGLEIAGLDQFRALVVALGLARRGVATAASHADGVKLRLSTRHDPPPPAGTPFARPSVEKLDDFWDGMAAGRSEIPIGPIHPDPKAPFRIFASSGTTGRPKTLMVDHATSARRVYDQWHVFPFSPVHAPAIALNTVWGMTQALRTLWAGGALVLSHTLALHGAALRHGVTSIACAPVVLAEILAAMPADAPPPASLRRIEVGGSPLPAKLRQQAEARLCPVVFTQFGCSEADAVASAPCALLDETPGAVGYLHPGARAEAVDERHRPLPRGAKGWLRVLTSGTVSGYLNDPVATAEHFRDGWFYTGDIGQVTADGLLILHGRANEVINAGGVKVEPGVIERVLDERPEVIECAAFGAPDDDGVIRVWAAVVAKDPIDDAALSAHLAKRLGNLAPRSLMQVSGLPRTATGKIQRAVLTEMAAHLGRRPPRG